MKKIVIFGGGTGLSCILNGLKLFPVDVTAVIAVSDDGSSTGVLREELDIPAVGDLGKVLLAMANVDDDFVKLLRYRFEKEGSLMNHPVRNVLLAALIDLKGNLTEATKYMSQLLQVKGTVLPITEDKVDLIGYGKDEEYVGESEVSQNIENIERLGYDHPVEINPEIPEKIAEADLIILSPGSLYTSTLPHLIIPDIQQALEHADAPIMYISNLGTQPGETDGYNVSDVDITKDDIPENTDIAVIGAPRTDYMQADVDKLERFLDNGGKGHKQIVFFSHAAQAETPLLNKVLNKYGLTVGEGIVCESRQDMYYNQPYYTIAGEVSEYLLSDMESKKPELLVAQSRPVETVDAGNSSLDIYKLFSSSDSGFTAETNALVNGETKTLKNAKQCYAALSIDQSTGAGVAVFGTSSVAEDQFVAYGQYANKDMLLTLFNKMTGKTPEIKIEPKIIAAKGFEISQAQKNVLKWTFIFVLPLIAAVFGIVITVRRKRR